MGGFFFISGKLEKIARDVLKKETGTVYKDPGGKVKVCLAYPNSYHLGMSNLGLQSLYGFFNAHERCVSERVFLPDEKTAAELKRTGARLLSLETRTPLSRFDIVAFSISFEDDYFSIPRMLRLAGVPPLAADRDAAHPLVMAGGIAVMLNPEPVADFFDFIFIGEADESIGKIIDLYQRLSNEEVDRAETLQALSSIEGVYVPSLYEVEYNGPAVGRVRALHGAPETIKRVRASRFEETPPIESIVVTPLTEFKQTHLVEVERGCGRGCRFCAAGFIYLPPRARATDAVRASITRGFQRAGKVGLVGPAVAEYPGLKGLLTTHATHVEATAGRGDRRGRDRRGDRRARRPTGEMTLSSLRLDTLDSELLKLLKDCGYKTVTIAPEAATERMRNVINKFVTDERIDQTVGLIKEAGFRKIKMYFMVGLPTETDDDARAIGELALRVKKIFRATVALSINQFVPKPFTPFQWHPLERPEVIEKRYSIIKNALRGDRGIKIKTLSPRAAFVQATLAMGDRRLSETILGGPGAEWRRAIKGAGLEAVAFKKREFDDPLPWDIIDHGIDKSYLWEEYQKGLVGAVTAPCSVDTCTRCGVCASGGDEL